MTGGLGRPTSPSHSSRAVGKLTGGHTDSKPEWLVSRPAVGFILSKQGHQTQWKGACWGGKHPANWPWKGRALLLAVTRIPARPGPWALDERRPWGL